MKNLTAPDQTVNLLIEVKESRLVHQDNLTLMFLKLNSQTDLTESFRSSVSYTFQKVNNLLGQLNEIKAE